MGRSAEYIAPIGVGLVYVLVGIELASGLLPGPAIVYATLLVWFTIGAVLLAVGIAGFVLAALNERARRDAEARTGALR